MREQIRELEKITEGLQQELEKKEQIYEEMKIENNRFSSDEYQQSIKGPLYEEITFLKRHHEVEMGLIKENYEKKLILQIGSPILHDQTLYLVDTQRVAPMPQR
jgi:hypothetical protein